MSDLLNSILALFSPLGLIWLLLIVQSVRHLRRRSRPWGGVWLSLTLIYSLFTCTALPSLLLYSLERQFPPVPLADLPNCDAIVTLGGASEPAPNEPAGFHLSQAADRLTAALTVAKAGKAPQLVLGGGGFKHGPIKTSEADAVKHWIDQGGYSPVPVISLGVCDNTHDESVKVAQLFREHGWKQVILVTSAAHMRRAADTFRKSGVTVIPYPANYASGVMRAEGGAWVHVPNDSGFSSFEDWWHEVIGWNVYHWRGWI